MLAEVEGDGLAILLAGLGVAAKIAEDRLEESEVTGPRSLGEDLRK